MLFANKLKQLREQNNLLQRQMSAALEIDTGLYSKIERGERKAKREQVLKLSQLLNTDKDELLTLWLADQVTAVVADEANIAKKVLKIADNSLDEIAYAQNKVI